jgi:heme/copper-type cytochrome/quinol oxidase subunit 3
MTGSAAHPSTTVPAPLVAHVSTYEVLPPELPPPQPERPRLLIIATSLVSAAVVAGFAALFGVYLTQRAAAVEAGQDWLGDITIPLTQPNFMAVTMAMSVISVFWAVYACRNQDRANALIAVGLTLLFGFAYLSQTMFLLAIMNIPIAESGLVGWLIWALVGSHVAVTGAAMAYLAAMGLRTLGGQLTLRDAEGLTGAAMFWFVGVAVYFVLWYAVYITK